MTPSWTRQDSFFDFFQLFELFISYSESKNKNLNLRIYDVIGNVVFEKNTIPGESVQQISININEWARGVYILKGSVGETEVTKKIIIE